MEVDGGENAPVAPASPWAETAPTGDRDSASSLPIDAAVLEKLKKVVIDSVRVDEECKRRARARFQHALYGKLLGKPPPFELVRSTLLALWKEFGTNICISDLPNGFLLIRCDSEGVKEQLLFGGPWAVHGVTLQLTPWQPGFEPAFSKLTKALVWVQLHNLPVDYWDTESLEAHSASIGKLVKVDDYTSSLSRTRFARVCLEIDLAVPLRRGFWLEDGDKRTFVLALYERAPTFCFTCGVVGHEASSCTNRREQASGSTAVIGLASGGADGSVQRSPVQRTDLEIEHGAHASPVELVHTEDPGFAWIRPSRRRGRGRGRGGDGSLTARELHAPPVAPRREQLMLERSLHHEAIVGRELEMGRHVEHGDRAKVTCGHPSRVSQRSYQPDARLEPSSSRCNLHDTGTIHGIGTDGRRDMTNGMGSGGQGECSYRGGSHLSAPSSSSLATAPSSSSLAAVASDPCPSFYLPGSCPPVVDRTGGSDDEVLDGKAIGIRMAVSSPPLLISSLDQRSLPHDDEHRMLVARVQHAFHANMESFADDSEMEGSDDDRPLWELHKSVRKESRDRKGIQIMGGVQKKKGKKMAGGKRS